MAGKGVKGKDLKNPWLIGCGGGCLGIILVFVLLFGGCVAIFSGSSDDDDDNSMKSEKIAETSTAEDTSAESEEPEEDSEIVVKMKQNVTIENVTYKVESVDYANTVAGYTAEGGQYAVVKIKVYNGSNEATMINDSDFQYVVDGNLYKADATTTAYYDNGFFLENINPGMSKTASVVYEVPKDLSGKQELLQIEPNMFKKDKAYVLIKK